MFLVASCSCLCPIHWNRVLSRKWIYSWSSADMQALLQLHLTDEHFYCRLMCGFNYRSNGIFFRFDRFLQWFIKIYGNTKWDYIHIYYIYICIYMYVFGLCYLKPICKRDNCSLFSRSWMHPHPFREPLHYNRIFKTAKPSPVKLARHGYFYSVHIKRELFI